MTMVSSVPNQGLTLGNDFQILNSLTASTTNSSVRFSI